MFHIETEFVIRQNKNKRDDVDDVDDDDDDNDELLNE
jgi:hypothetical protein